MNGSRQEYALAHPLNRADGDIAPYRAVRTHATGLLIGHLRIGVTEEEFTAMPDPPGGVLDDAGESGPERKRIR